MRQSWETGHTIRFMLQLIAWSLVVLSVLLDRHEMPSERHVHAPEEAPSPACIGNTENVIGIIKIRSRGVRYTREHTIPAGLDIMHGCWYERSKDYDHDKAAT